MSDKTFIRGVVKSASNYTLTRWLHDLERHHSEDEELIAIISDEIDARANKEK